MIVQVAAPRCARTQVRAMAVQQEGVQSRRAALALAAAALLSVGVVESAQANAAAAKSSTGGSPLTSPPACPPLASHTFPPHPDATHCKNSLHCFLVDDMPRLVCRPNSPLNAPVACPPPSAAASMSSYTMEGTKKSGVSPKRKAKLMAKVRARAEAAGGTKE